MNTVIDQYESLMGEVDNWFEYCLSLHSDLIACRKGCSACCRGLFDITLLDALCLKRGFDLLPVSIRHDVQEKAVAPLVELSCNWPEFCRPWTLNHIPEKTWDKMMPEDDETPCSLLSSDGICLVYSHRPMTCRLNGIPLVDTSGEALFDEWCTMNFKFCDPMGLVDIRNSFNELFTQELLLFRELTRKLFGRAVSELDTIIPAAVFMDYDTIRQIHLLKQT